MTESANSNLDEKKEDNNNNENGEQGSIPQDQAQTGNSANENDNIDGKAKEIGSKLLTQPQGEDNSNPQNEVELGTDSKPQDEQPNEVNSNPLDEKAQETVRRSVINPHKKSEQIIHDKTIDLIANYTIPQELEKGQTRVRALERFHR